MDTGDDARYLAARTRPDQVRLEEIRVPDSAAAAEAEGLTRAESSPMLYGHALRTYFFAALLAAHDGMRYDEELLYVGCVLHDIGLTAGFDDPLRPFEHVSADTCAELVERHGWALPRRYRLHRAVVLHMAPVLPPAEEVLDCQPQPLRGFLCRPRCWSGCRGQSSWAGIGRWWSVAGMAGRLRRLQVRDERRADILLGSCSWPAR